MQNARIVEILKRDHGYLKDDDAASARYITLTLYLYEKTSSSVHQPARLLDH